MSEVSHIFCKKKKILKTPIKIHISRPFNKINKIKKDKYYQHEIEMPSRAFKSMNIFNFICILQFLIKI